MVKVSFFMDQVEQARLFCTTHSVIESVLTTTSFFALPPPKLHHSSYLGSSQSDTGILANSHVSTHAGKQKK
jgi:hypothetical protein